MSINRFRGYVNLDLKCKLHSWRISVFPIRTASAVWNCNEFHVKVKFAKPKGRVRFLRVWPWLSTWKIRQECVHPDSIHWRLSKLSDIPAACNSVCSNLDCHFHRCSAYLSLPSSSEKFAPDCTYISIKTSIGRMDYDRKRCCVKLIEPSHIR